MSKKKASAPSKCINCGATPATHFVHVSDTKVKGPYCSNCYKKAK